MSAKFLNIKSMSTWEHQVKKYQLKVYRQMHMLPENDLRPKPYGHRLYHSVLL